MVGQVAELTLGRGRLPEQLLERLDPVHQHGGRAQQQHRTEHAQTQPLGQPRTLPTTVQRGGVQRHAAHERHGDGQPERGGVQRDGEEHVQQQEQHPEVGVGVQAANG